MSHSNTQKANSVMFHGKKIPSGIGCKYFSDCFRCPFPECVLNKRRDVKVD